MRWCMRYVICLWDLMTNYRLNLKAVTSLCCYDEGSQSLLVMIVEGGINSPINALPGLFIMEAVSSGRPFT